MQKRLLLIILSIIGQFVFVSLLKAQCADSPLNCSINFNKEIFNDKQILSSSGNRYASGSAQQYDVNYYNKKDPVLTDCGTPSKYECSFDGAALTYDVYYPDGKVYPCYKTQPLPVIFLSPVGDFLIASVILKALQITAEILQKEASWPLM